MKVWLATALLLATACSRTTSSGSDDGGNATGPDGGGACNCSVTDNGAFQTLACGTSGCVNGVSYACDANGNVASGGNCATFDDAGGSTHECSQPTDCAPVLHCVCPPTGDVTVQDCTPAGTCVKSCSEESGCS